MIRLRNFLPIVVVLVGAAILGTPSKAHATFEVVLSETGFTSLTIVDNMTGDGNSAVGTISITNLTFGNFLVTVQTSVSNAAQGVLPATVTTTVTVFNNDAGVTHTLDILTSDSGFTTPGGGTKVAMKSTLADTSPIQDPTDTFLSTIGSTSGTMLTSTTSPSSASVVDSETAPPSPYTLENMLTLTNVGAALSNGQGNANSEIQAVGTTSVSAVPAPAGLVLLLTGLPLLGLGGLLSRRRKTAAIAG